MTTTAPGSSGRATGTAAAPPSPGSERRRRWEAWLLAEVDGASLALFRAAFYLIIAWEVVRFFQQDRVLRYYIEPQVLFGYLDFIRPWPGQGMVVHFVALGALALLAAAGLFYRVTAPLCAAALAYFFLLDKAQYLNHLYLCSLLALLLAVAPAHRAFSLDRLRWLRRSRRGGLPGPPPSPTVPRWPLLILRLQIAIVYFYGGVAKLNADWLAGRPLDQWLPERSHVPLIGPLLLLPEAPLFVAWAGLLIDLSAPFLLLSRRGLPFGIAICTLFHITNAALFKIGIFPYAMIATLALFPDPAWPRRLFRLPSPAPSPAPSDLAPRPPGRAARALLAALHAYLLVQLLVPLRHWLYPGDVAWNEAGHRFSWRMKLRDKQIEELEMYVVDPRTGTRETIALYQWLTFRQVDEMGTRPDMLVDFAHVIADRWEAATGVRPKVTAWVLVSLNGHPPRPLLDPTMDLAAQPRGLFSPW